MNLSERYFFGNEYIMFILYIAGALVLAQLVNFILIRYFKRIINKSKSRLDDEILSIASRPLFYAIFFTGIFFALKTLSALLPYSIWINRIYFIIIVLLAATVVSQILIALISHWLTVEKRFERTPRLVGKIITLLIYLIGFGMVLNYFKINITPIIATLGIGGLAAGLALQSTLSNFFAGLHIITDRSFTVGDLVEMHQQNVSGYIEDIGWRTTRIRTLTDTIAIVPNSKLAESIIINAEALQREMVINVQCGVAYNSDLSQVEKIVLETAKEIQQSQQGAVPSYQPTFWFHTFGDSNIDFTVTMKIIRFNHKAAVIHAFIKKIIERFSAEHIEISWPVRKIYNLNIGNESKSKV